jgi:hypothetical protein
VLLHGLALVVAGLNQLGEPQQPHIRIHGTEGANSIVMASGNKKESALDLARFIDKGVRVKLAGGREGDCSYDASWISDLGQFLVPSICSQWSA